MGVASSNGVPGTCVCFSLCTEEHALAFQSRLPPLLYSRHSPWDEYLTAVYGRKAQLPFALRRLTIFFRGIANIPMASCKLNASSGRWYAGRDRSKCSQDVCDRWLLPEQPPATMLPPPASKLALQELLARRLGLADGRTRATVILHRQRNGELPDWTNLIIGTESGTAFVHTPCQPQLSSPECQHQPRSAVHSGGWVEVMRMRMSYAEGVDGYGCWLYPVVGSGIWVNVGRRTMVLEPAAGELPHQMDAALNGSALFHEYVLKYGAQDAAALPPVWRPGKRRVERFPRMAHALGYESVQVLQRGTTQAFAYPELVMTSEACSHQRASIGTCPPVPLAAGTRQQLPCECSEALTHLNCARSQRSTARHQEHTSESGLGASFDDDGWLHAWLSLETSGDDTAATAPGVWTLTISTFERRERGEVSRLLSSRNLGPVLAHDAFPPVQMERSPRPQRKQVELIACRACSSFFAAWPINARNRTLPPLCLPPLHLSLGTAATSATDANTTTDANVGTIAPKAQPSHRAHSLPRTPWPSPIPPAQDTNATELSERAPRLLFLGDSTLEEIALLAVAAAGYKPTEIEADPCAVTSGSRYRQFRVRGGRRAEIAMRWGGHHNCSGNFGQLPHTSAWRADLRAFAADWRPTAIVFNVAAPHHLYACTQGKLSVAACESGVVQYVRFVASLLPTAAVVLATMGVMYSRVYEDSLGCNYDIRRLNEVAKEAALSLPVPVTVVEGFEMAFSTLDLQSPEDKHRLEKLSCRALTRHCTCASADGGLKVVRPPCAEVSRAILAAVIWPSDSRTIT